MTVKPEDLERVQAGRVAEQIRHTLEPWYQDRVKTVKKRIFKVIEDEGTVPADLAIQAWLALYEIDQFDASLRKKARVGLRTSERIGPDMDL